MKKLLISSAVAGILLGATVVYADDAHHPEQAGAPVIKSAPVKSTPSKQPATPDQAMSNTGDTAAADAQMVKAQERMKQAQALMTKLREAKDPAGRKELMQQHTQALRDTMGMMREMKMAGMMGAGQGMGMMGQGKGQQTQMGCMMPMHPMMEARMEMMQMMMEQMFERQDMLMQSGK